MIDHRNCILQVWNHGSSLQPCKCPLCRRQITLLVPSQASSQQIHNPEAAEILKKIEAYNRLFGSQSTSLNQRVQDLPFLLKRLFRELMDPQRSLPFVIKARLYLAAVAKRTMTTTVVLRGGDGGGWRRVMVGGG
ncbi:putative E3 ubiquitin-protein ligase RNF170 [Helianthus annuus]|nr:putative E3 ubiquitin-protein ligase RNF170 [Helianthus annuus]